MHFRKGMMSSSGRDDEQFLFNDGCRRQARSKQSAEWNSARNRTKNGTKKQRFILQTVRAVRKGYPNRKCFAATPMQKTRVVSCIGNYMNSF